MSTSIGLREANQYLSRYIEVVEGGEEVVITRRGVPVAKLVPVKKVEAARAEKKHKAALAHLLNTKFEYPDELKGGYNWTRDDGYDLEKFEKRDQPDLIDSLK